AADEAGSDVGGPLAQEVARHVGVSAAGVGGALTDASALDQADDRNRQRRQKRTQHQGRGGNGEFRPFTRNSAEIAYGLDRAPVEGRAGPGAGQQGEQGGRCRNPDDKGEFTQSGREQECDPAKPQAADNHRRNIDFAEMQQEVQRWASWFEYPLANPVRWPTWPRTISAATPLRKPVITALETKRTRNPKRNKPAAS